MIEPYDLMLSENQPPLSTDSLPIKIHFWHFGNNVKAYSIYTWHKCTELKKDVFEICRRKIICTRFVKSTESARLRSIYLGRPHTSATRIVHLRPHNHCATFSLLQMSCIHAHQKQSCSFAPLWECQHHRLTTIS